MSPKQSYGPTRMNKLSKLEVKKRLETAKDAGAIATLVCILAPVIYLVLIYVYRSDIIEFIRAIARNTFGFRPTCWFLMAVAGAPAVFLPKLYAVLSHLIASSAHLACPKCGTLISSGRDWRICLYTGKCPHCQQVIISE